MHGSRHTCGPHGGHGTMAEKEEKNKEKNVGTCDPTRKLGFKRVKTLKLSKDCFLSKSFFVSFQTHTHSTTYAVASCLLQPFHPATTVLRRPPSSREPSLLVCFVCSLFCLLILLLKSFVLSPFLFYFFLFYVVTFHSSISFFFSYVFFPLLLFP